MTLAMTQGQRDELNGQGFTVLENVLAPAELKRLSAAMDEVANQARKLRNLGPDEGLDLRNAVARHEAIADLLDHPRILPLVVDADALSVTKISMDEPTVTEILAPEVYPDVN